MSLFSFFSCRDNSKKQETNSTEVLTEEKRAAYRAQLEMDKNKDFDSEFRRTTDLERKLIDTFRFDAVKLMFERRNSKNYYLLGNLPADCPWAYLNKETNSSFIDANFAPLKNKMPDMIDSMKSRCMLIFAERKENSWDLHYLLDMKLYDNRPYYRIYTGGQPNKDPQPNKNLVSFGWSIPKDLQEFYAIHDGFGEVYDACYVMRSDEIRVMGEMMNPIAEREKVKTKGYAFNDLLEFFPDGAGNAQCFLRVEKDNNQTVDWDHEIWEISEKSDFYAFINERMSQIDEE